MSQLKAEGINPITGRTVSIVYGYDSVPGFKAGYFFQVYLTVDDEDWNPDSENCILNEGMLNGIDHEKLLELQIKYKMKKARPINKKHWI